MSEPITKETMQRLLTEGQYMSLDEQKAALKKQNLSFLERTGHTYEEFIARWEAGEIPDTPENASFSIEAFGLRQGFIKAFPEYQMDGKDVFVRAVLDGKLQLATADKDKEYGVRPVDIVAVLSLPRALRLASDIITQVSIEMSKKQ